MALLVLPTIELYYSTCTDSSSRAIHPVFKAGTDHAKHALYCSQCCKTEHMFGSLGSIQRLTRVTYLP
jgi:hypothetical protein